MYLFSKSFLSNPCLRCEEFSEGKSKHLKYLVAKSEAPEDLIRIHHGRDTKGIILDTLFRRSPSLRVPRWEKALSFTALGRDQQLIARIPRMRPSELELSWLSPAIKISHSGGDPVQGICRTGNWPLNGFLAKYLPICPSMKCKFCSTRKPSWKVRCYHLASVQAARKR